MIRVVEHEGAPSFLARAEAWLRKHEDVHNVILGLSLARESVPAGEDDALYLTVERDDEVVGCVLRTPPHKVLVTELPADAYGPVADRLAERFERIPCVLGPTEVAEGVAMAWVERNGGGWRPGMEQRIYRLDEVVQPTDLPPGALRPATSDDVPLALAWGEGFARDAGAQFRIERASVERWVDAGHLHVWEDGEPRSIAVAQGMTGRGVRIGYVYTPPEWRGRGYASACVAALSQKMLDDGYAFCILYTDLSNATSNALYQRIGYRPIADVRDFDLIAESVS